MPGFFGLLSQDIGKSIDFDVELSNYRETTAENSSFPHAYFKRSFFRRFLPDQSFDKVEDYFIGFTGTFLNRRELLNRYKCSNNAGLILELFKRSGSSFPREIRGDFSGFLYNEKDQSLVIFTSLFNEKPVFYLADRQRQLFLFSNSFYDSVKACGKIQSNLTLSETACYYLLTFGHMLEDETLFSEIKKVPPASVLTYRNNTLTIGQYYSLNEAEPVKMSRKDLINELDLRFEAAIREEYEKDIELGVRHLATLSGGLDSRINVLYANKLGYGDIHTFTFSRSDYLDDTIARKIAGKYKFPHHFINLDPGDFLRNFREPVRANGGLAVYVNGAAAFYSPQFLEMEDFGLIHTGQLGDAILGTYLDGPRITTPDAGIVKGLAISSELLSRIPESVIQRINAKYKTAEILKFYERGVNLIFNGNIMFQQYAEQASPFLHAGFVDFVLGIAPEIRYREFLYIDWIHEKIREANRFTWEKFRLRPVPLYFNKSAYYFPRLVKMAYAGLYKYGMLPDQNMVPIEFWYRNNQALRNDTNHFISDKMYLIEKYPELHKDVNLLRNNEKFAVKGLIVTLLAALDQYRDILTKSH